MPRQDKISAVVIACNEEKKIERCLRSLAWADEIVIVDSFSTDRTVEICRRYTDRVYLHPWPGSASEQRNVAAGHAAHDWIFTLDADEVVTVGLRDEITALFAAASPAAALYLIPRREYFAGRWIEAGGWYPQYKTNLYRKSLGQWTGTLHEKVVSRGLTERLTHPILHDGYASFRVFMDKFNHYSSVEAERDYRENKRFSLARALFQPLERFFGRFIRHRGYRDGLHGLFMAAVIAINYFMREMKLFEQQYREKQRAGWDDRYRAEAVGADGGASADARPDRKRGAA
jgi:glycosyltransferase involved in cell wall biosynthesis